MSMQDGFGGTGRRVPCQDRRTISETLTRQSPGPELSLQARVRWRVPIWTGERRALAHCGGIRRRVPPIGATGSREIACPPGSAQIRAPAAGTRGTGRRESRVRNIGDFRQSIGGPVGGMGHEASETRGKPATCATFRAAQIRPLPPRITLDSCHNCAQSCQVCIRASDEPDPPGSTQSRAEPAATC